MSAGAKVLVVEDQRDLGELLAHNFRVEGLDARVAGDGNEAVRVAESWAPDLVILDLMLPGRDGFEVLRAIRGRTRELPELLERVHALLRRRAAITSGPEPTESFTFADVCVDPASRSVVRGGETVPLTPKGFDLPLALIRRGGRVATRTELLREVWGYGPLVLSRTVDSHVAELRRKLEADPAEPRHLVTVYKSGYRFQG